MGLRGSDFTHFAVTLMISKQSHSKDRMPWPQAGMFLREPPQIYGVEALLVEQTEGGHWPDLLEGREKLCHADNRVRECNLRGTLRFQHHQPV